MTRTTRTQIGGWGALLAAVAIPLEILTLVIASGPVDERLSSLPFTAAEAIRTTGLLVAVVGLDQWLREIQPRLAFAALVAGILGAGLGLFADAMVVAGMSSSSFDLVIFVAANTAIGCWYILTGAVLSRADEDLRRIGWVGQLGGVGSILATALLASGIQSAVRAPSWLDYAQLLGVFAIVFLVRIWRYAALGRLPGPGLI